MPRSYNCFQDWSILCSLTCLPNPSHHTAPCKKFQEKSNSQTGTTFPIQVIYLIKREIIFCLKFHTKEKNGARWDSNPHLLQSGWGPYHLDHWHLAFPWVPFARVYWFRSKDLHLCVHLPSAGWLNLAHLPICSMHLHWTSAAFVQWHLPSTKFWIFKYVKIG